MADKYGCSFSRDDACVINTFNQRVADARAALDRSSAAIDSTRRGTPGTPSKWRMADPPSRHDR